MATSTSQGNDFEALARQYWTAWGDAMRGAATPAGHAAGPQAAHAGRHQGLA